MHLTVIQRVTGILIMLFSLTLIPPMLIGLIYQETELDAFINSYFILLALGFMLWLPVKNVKKDLRLRDGFVVVVVFWVVLSAAGSLPLILNEQLDISITDAVFESISGLTTTGATVIIGLDDLPHSILFYRQELQWLGGMGIIVLAVAILPMLGIGGMQLYRAETPGPVKDNKLTPRIAETARALWYIYLGLTVACALGYWLAGMNLFDAVSHSFSTVAIGGFSTHDESMGYFDSAAVDIVAIVFMLLGGVNFALHFAVFKRWNLKVYLRDAEFRMYISVLAIVSVITVSYLQLTDYTRSFDESLLQGVFHVVSIGTTAGFSASEYYLWPGFLPVLLLFVSFIGGCALSTGGGMKVIRVMLLLKQGMRELTRLIHPNAIVTVKVNKSPVSDNIINAVWGFFATYVALFALMMLLLMASGLDQITAFSAVAATINNLGPGLGEVAANYATINDFAKWVLSFAMILGRLEIFTLLVLFIPRILEKVVADWELIYAEKSVADATPAEVLKDNAHLLPASGAALDYASGLAGNAQLLAKLGLAVTAWDYSRVAVEKINQYAAAHNLKINAETKDLEQDYQLLDGQFDVVCVSYFLHRQSMTKLYDLLAPDGLLFYQTFSGPQRNSVGPSREAFRLRRGELLQTFSAMELLFYREDPQDIEPRSVYSDQVLFVAKK